MPAYERWLVRRQIALALTEHALAATGYEAWSKNALLRYAKLVEEHSFALAAQSRQEIENALATEFMKIVNDLDTTPWCADTFERWAQRLRRSDYAKADPHEVRT